MIQFTCAEDKKSSCCHYWIFTFLCFCCLKNQLLRFHTIKRLNKQLLPTYTVIQYSTFRSNKILNAKFWSLIMQRSQMHIQQRNLLHFDTYNHCMSTDFFWHQYHWGFYLYLNDKLLHVFLQELPVEVIPDGVINEALRSLGFTTGLVLKHHIVIPPKTINA